MGGAREQGGRQRTATGARAAALLVLAGALAPGCAEDCVDDKSAVVVTVEGDGSPILSSLDWTHESGESGSMDCDGTCEFKPAEEGTITVVVTPLDASWGEAQEDTVGFFLAQDDKCEQPVYSYLDFSFTSSAR